MNLRKATTVAFFLCAASGCKFVSTPFMAATSSQSVTVAPPDLKTLTANTNGDGDSTQIQAAVDELAANGGGRVRLAVGTFNLNAPVKLRRNVTIEGSGDQETILSVNSGDGAFRGESGYYVKRAIVRNFKIINNNQPAATVIRLRGIKESIFSRIHAHGFTEGRFFDIQTEPSEDPTSPGEFNTYLNEFSHLKMTGGGKRGFVIGGSLATSATSHDSTVVTLNSYRDIYLEGIKEIGIEIVKSSDHESFRNIYIQLASSSAFGIGVRSYPGYGISDTQRTNENLGVYNHKFAQVTLNRVDPTIDPFGVVLYTSSASTLVLGLKTNLSDTKYLIDGGAFSYYLAGKLKPAAVTWNVCDTLDSRPAIPKSHNSTTETVSAGASAADVQSAIDRAKNAGGGLVLLQAGTYNFTDTINLKSKVAVMGAGYGTILNSTAPIMFTAHSVDDAGLGEFLVNTFSSGAMISVKDAQTSLFQNILFPNSQNATILQVAADQRETKWNCFRNLIGRANVGLVAQGTLSPAPHYVMENEFEDIKFSSVQSYGFVLKENVIRNYWKNPFAWLVGNGSTAFWIGNNTGEQVFLNPVATQEPNSLPGINAPSPAQSLGFDFTSTSPQTILGFSYSHWNWSSPFRTAIAHPTHLLFLNMCASGGIGADGSFSEVYGYSIDGLNTNPLNVTLVLEDVVPPKGIKRGSQGL